MASTAVCLDVAIDHRIRRLLKPGLSIKVNPSRPDGEHVEKLRQLYPSVLSKRNDASHELRVTEQLAEPLSQGGLVVALLRPANDHPFADGVDVVVEKSPTLRALRDVFKILDLDLVKDVTVLDALPFMPKKDIPNTFGNGMTEYLAARQGCHQVFLEAMVAKRPDVVLCMWRHEGKPKDIWEGKEIEGQGVGQLFDDEKTTLRDHRGSSIKTRRVNVFHPGYCVNHQPEYSQFRQLLMLEVAHGYHLLNGSWHEEDWMAELRKSCMKETMELIEAKKKRSIPEPHVVYARALTKIQALIPELAVSKNPHDERPKLLYGKLVAAKWTESMNDASLCLKKAAAQLPQRDLVSVHDTIGAQADMAICTLGFVIGIAKLIGTEKIELRINQGNGVFSEQYVKHLRDQWKGISNPHIPEQSVHWYGNLHLKRGVIDFLLGLNNAFLDGCFTQRIRGLIGLQMSLASASKAFLAMACDMEALLGTLAGYSKEKGPTAELSGDEMAESFERLALSQRHD
ncbi:hypothetical protein GGI35DRAFT_433913 [Trichoderma velutinum]